MSAFYLMAVAFIWFKLTQWTGKLWLKWRKNKPNTSRFLIDLSFVLIFLAWFAASFWYGGGRVYYYDAEVKRLCAIDGGVKVYEKVVLSPEDYDKLMEEGLKYEDNSSPAQDYFFGSDKDIYIRSDNPTIRRSCSIVMRRKDKKIIAMLVSYHRVGGGFPGWWMSSSFRCPQPKTNFELNQAIFIKETVK
ncbi:hypothetical protein [Stenoxybacter acetivorans]|uniref:hypothetical protein n=1 Tax=Stenoxybacter acetivorans TaxID=422441 RepID=UPI00056AFD66|nr:hypothetical protein [Stenoxybacter acetivorans]